MGKFVYYDFSGFCAPASTSINLGTYRRFWIPGDHLFVREHSQLFPISSRDRFAIFGLHVYSPVSFPSLSITGTACTARSAFSFRRKSTHVFDTSAAEIQLWPIVLLGQSRHHALAANHILENL